MNAAKMTLTATVVAAALGLALGLAAAPAKADCARKHTGNHPHCIKGDTTGEPAFLTLGGDMTTNDLAVTVKQNSAKRLAFGDTSFDAPGPGIMVDFDIDVDDTNCAVDPNFRGTADAPLDEDLLLELNGTFIPAGYLEVRIDKKKETAGFFIEYFVDDGSSLDGRVRIQFGHGHTFTPNTVKGVLDFPGTNFTISGPIIIWWSGGSLREDKILVCEGQVVDVELT